MVIKDFIVELLIELLRRMSLALLLLLLSLGTIKGKKYIILGFKGISVRIFHEKIFLPMLISSKVIIRSGFSIHNQLSR